MSLLQRIYSFCRTVLRQRRLDEDLDLEIRSFIEMSAEEKAQRGVALEKAPMEAQLENGGVEQVKETVRDIRVGVSTERFLQDVRYGSRVLRRNQGFAAVIIAIVALGIGATTAIFSVVDTVMFKPLPFPNADRLIRIQSMLVRTGNGGVASYPDFFDWRARNHSFEDMAVFRTDDFTLDRPAGAERLHGAVVSAKLFPLLGVSPAIGRSFLPQEDTAKAANGTDATILSYALWQRDFGSDRAVLGRAIQLNGQPFTVIGIMPPSFQFPIEAEPIELWTTIAIDKTGPLPITNQRGAHYLDVIGLLKPGANVVQAKAELAKIAANLSREHPENKPRTVQLVPEIQGLVGPIRTPLLVLLGAVACVLLIVCVNVANLLTARSTRRYKEMAVRIALGASRGRVVRQLLTENLLLSLLGGALGLGLALALVKGLVGLMPAQVPRLSSIGVDGRLLTFAVLISLMSGIIFGLGPALRTSKFDVADWLKESWTRSGGDSKSHSRFRSVLVGGEIALAVILLLGATLLLESFVHLTRVDPGFDPHHVLTFEVNVPDTRPGTTPDTFFRELSTRITSLPGVTSVSAAAGLPLTGDNISSSVEIEGQPTPRGSRPTIDFNAVELAYFRTLDVTFVRGRDFTQHDTTKTTPVVIVNRTFANQFFPNQNPIGKHVRPGIGNGYGLDEPPMREIVGIVGDVKESGLQVEAAPEAYAPLAQSPFSPLFFVVRTATDPGGYVDAIRHQLALITKEAPMYHVVTLDEYFHNSLLLPRLVALLVSGFACLAVILACLGVYGVVSYVTAQRTREIGIRIALGSGNVEVLKLVLLEGLRPAIIGVLAGIAISLKATGVLSSLLYGLAPTDPLTFGVAFLLMMGVTLIASYIPAHRAANVDPMQSLRHD